MSSGLTAAAPVNQSELSIICVNQSELRIFCVNQSEASITVHALQHTVQLFHHLLLPHLADGIIEVSNHSSKQ